MYSIYNENIYIYGFQSISFLWPTCLHEDIYLQCIALTLQNVGLYDEFHNPLWLFHVAMNWTYVLSIQNIVLANPAPCCSDEIDAILGLYCPLRVKLIITMFSILDWKHKTIKMKCLRYNCTLFQLHTSSMDDRSIFWTKEND